MDLGLSPTWNPYVLGDLSSKKGNRLKLLRNGHDCPVTRCWEDHGATVGKKNYSNYFGFHLASASDWKKEENTAHHREGSATTSTSYTTLLLLLRVIFSDRGPSWSSLAAQQATVDVFLGSGEMWPLTVREIGYIYILCIYTYI